MGQYHKFPCADGLAVAFEPISATLRGLQYTIVYYLVLIAQKKIDINEISPGCICYILN